MTFSSVSPITSNRLVQLIAKSGKTSQYILSLNLNMALNMMLVFKILLNIVIIEKFGGISI